MNSDIKMQIINKPLFLVIGFLILLILLFSETSIAFKKDTVREQDKKKISATKENQEFKIEVLDSGYEIFKEQ